MLLVDVIIISRALLCIVASSDPIIPITATFPPRIVTEIPPASVSFITWLNAASQSVWTPATLFVVESSAEPKRALVALTLFDDTQLSVDVATQTTPESIAAPAFVSLNEWVLVAVSITAGCARNVTIWLMLPDGSSHTASKSLSSDMQHSNATLVTVGGGNAYLASFAALDYALGGDDVRKFFKDSVPNQRFSSAWSSGGQIFDDSAPLTIRCQHPETVIAEIVFASFGRPLGVYPNFLINPACHSAATQHYVTAQCLGRPSCIVSGDIGRLGDPCPLWRKNLAVVAKCIDARYVTPIEIAIQACNVSLVVQARNTSLAEFAQFFVGAANISSDRVPFVTLQPQSATLQVLTFTLLPDGDRSARQIAEQFDARMQSIPSPNRSMAPLGVKIVDLELAQCAPGQYAVRPDRCRPSKLQSAPASHFGAQVGTPLAVLIVFGAAAAACMTVWYGREPARHPPVIKVPADGDPPDTTTTVSKGKLATGPPGPARLVRPRSRADAISIQILTPPRSLRSGAASKFIMRSAATSGSEPVSQRSFPMTVLIESGPAQIRKLSDLQR